MRAAICDMVAISRHLNVTLIVPEPDKTSFWADPSDFQEIFDVDHFILSLRDEVRILKELPPKLKPKVERGFLYSMQPVNGNCVAGFNLGALTFTPQIKELGRKLYSGCNSDEVEELTRMRYAYPWREEKVINSDLKRKYGLCPLTSEETVLTFRALDIDRKIQIYVATGEIYGGERRMASLAKEYPKLVRKETLLEPSNLRSFISHGSIGLSYVTRE
ncbi:hypothetical protein VNO77_27539 [Canavalia gladiata]|uniref:O-fucosyltransferase family protein n=1 Tax=Canavalia gladiata TaxID=3824 RepID=A0AAN9KUY5_CANGL